MLGLAEGTEIQSQDNIDSRLMSEILTTVCHRTYRLEKYDIGGHQMHTDAGNNIFLYTKVYLDCQDIMFCCDQLLQLKYHKIKLQ